MVLFYDGKNQEDKFKAFYKYVFFYEEVESGGYIYKDVFQVFLVYDGKESGGYIYIMTFSKCFCSLTGNNQEDILKGVFQVFFYCDGEQSE